VPGVAAPGEASRSALKMQSRIGERGHASWYAPDLKENVVRRLRLLAVTTHITSRPLPRAPLVESRRTAVGSRCRDAPRDYAYRLADARPSPFCGISRWGTGASPPPGSRPGSDRRSPKGAGR
jgi:hypothetical protein